MENSPSSVHISSLSFSRHAFLRTLQAFLPHSAHLLSNKFAMLRQCCSCGKCRTSPCWSSQKMSHLSASYATKQNKILDLSTCQVWADVQTSVSDFNFLQQFPLSSWFQFRLFLLTVKRYIRLLLPTYLATSYLPSLFWHNLCLHSFHSSPLQVQDSHHLPAHLFFNLHLSPWDSIFGMAQKWELGLRVKEQMR